MRIAEIPSFFPPYGGLFCMDQAKALAALGHEVTVLAHVQQGVTIHPMGWLMAGRGASRYVEDGVSVTRTDMRGLPRSPRLNMRRWVRGACRLFDSYAAGGGLPDVIHAHCCKWAGYAASLLAGRYGVPYVVTEHLPSALLAEELGEPDPGAWQVGLLRRAYEGARRVIPVSEELVDDLAPYFGKGYRWTAISNVIDTDFFRFRQRPETRGRAFRFCCLADYVPRKGYDVLLRAFALSRAAREGAELHIAGRYVSGRGCRREVARLAGSARVVSHGELDREGVRRLLYGSDCLVLATRGEAQPLVLLEAMSTGIPVITTDRVPLSARLGQGCRVVPVEDAAALASAMDGMAERYPGASESLSAAVRATCSPESVGKRLEAVLLEAAAGV